LAVFTVEDRQDRQPLSLAVWLAAFDLLAALAVFGAGSGMARISKLRTATMPSAIERIA
jgi:hypothetical protein